MWMRSTKAFNTHWKNNESRNLALKAQQYQVLKTKDTRALGTSLLIIPELRVLVLTKRHVGSVNEIDIIHVATTGHVTTRLALRTGCINFTCSLLSCIVGNPLFYFHRSFPLMIFSILQKDRKHLYERSNKYFAFSAESGRAS